MANDRMMDSAATERKSRLPKLVGSLAFYAASESWRAILILLGYASPPIVVAIYYHHVLSIERERFARQIDHLLRWTTPISTDFSNELAPGGHYSIVTADDGWKSFADNAVPELARRKVPVTVFAISHKLGETVDGITFDRIASELEIRRLALDSITIGSHTATHAVMTDLSEPDAMQELADSRQRLSAIVNSPVKCFCFPYGAFNQELAELAREAGYQRVFTCLPQLAHRSDFVVGRIRVDPSDWPLEFHLKVMGAYRWVPRMIGVKRRVVGVLRHLTYSTTDSEARTV